MQSQFLLLIAAVATLLVAQTAAKFQVKTPADAKKALEECREEFYVPDEIYEKYLNYEFPDHLRTSCFVKCFLEKLELFSEKKGFNERAMIKQFTYRNFGDVATVRHGLEKCIDHNEAESDVCTWANRVFSCWLPINRHVVRKVFA
ncbi:general odorant-binding protein 99a [Drosophila yakuba]|uniref:Odorant-binding protein 83g n=1 Tax=Drosophila yakuba TaxID=7245 RepID=B4PVL4_DROYA|nr:general odorant-binding protein 99a [Drosophila yakuba]EDW97823.1 Odorant-binding protein 83g [Drosophila yakuba]